MINWQSTGSPVFAYAFPGRAVSQPLGGAVHNQRERMRQTEREVRTETSERYYSWAEILGNGISSYSLSLLSYIDVHTKMINDNFDTHAKEREKERWMGRKRQTDRLTNGRTETEDGGREGRRWTELELER